MHRENKSSWSHRKEVRAREFEICDYFCDQLKRWVPAYYELDELGRVFELCHRWRKYTHYSYPHPFVSEHQLAPALSKTTVAAWLSLDWWKSFCNYKDPSIINGADVKKIKKIMAQIKLNPRDLFLTWLRSTNEAMFLFLHNNGFFRPEHALLLDEIKTTTVDAAVTAVVADREMSFEFNASHRRQLGDQCYKIFDRFLETSRHSYWMFQSPPPMETMIPYLMICSPRSFQLYFNRLNVLLNDFKTTISNWRDKIRFNVLKQMVEAGANVCSEESLYGDSLERIPKIIGCEEYWQFIKDLRTIKCQLLPPPPPKLNATDATDSSCSAGLSDAVEIVGERSLLADALPEKNLHLIICGYLPWLTTIEPSLTEVLEPTKRKLNVPCIRWIYEQSPPALGRRQPIVDFI